MTAPILPIVPIDQLNNYCWKDWEEWYQSCRIEVGSPVALTEAERRPLANSLQTRIFSLLLSHHPQMPVVFACMMDPSDKKVLECCVKWPQTLSSPPVLEGIAFENLTNIISDKDMAKMNYMVEAEGKEPREVAKMCLKNAGLIK